MCTQIRLAATDRNRKNVTQAKLCKCTLLVAAGDHNYNHKMNRAIPVMFLPSVFTRNSRSGNAPLVVLIRPSETWSSVNCQLIAYCWCAEVRHEIQKPF